MIESQRIAIVAVGGLFPSAPSPDRLWDAVVAGADLSRDVPEGRWILSPNRRSGPALHRQITAIPNAATFSILLLSILPRSIYARSSGGARSCFSSCPPRRQTGF